MTAFHHPDLFTGESWVRGLTLPPSVQVHVWPSVATISDWAFEDTHAYSHMQIFFLAEGHFHPSQLSSTGLTMKLVAIRMFNNHSHSEGIGERVCIYLSCSIYSRYWVRLFTYSFSFDSQNALKKALQSCGVRRNWGQSYRAGHDGALISTQVSVAPQWTRLCIQKGVIISPGFFF